jgi:hypothetical protein
MPYRRSRACNEGSSSSETRRSRSNDTAPTFCCESQEMRSGDFGSAHNVLSTYPAVPFQSSHSHMYPPRLINSAAQRWITAWGEARSFVLDYEPAQIRLIGHEGGMSGSKDVGTTSLTLCLLGPAQERSADGINTACPWRVRMPIGDSCNTAWNRSMPYLCQK